MGAIAGAGRRPAGGTGTGTGGVRRNRRCRRCGRFVAKSEWRDGGLCARCRGQLARQDRPWVRRAFARGVGTGIVVSLAIGLAAGIVLGWNPDLDFDFDFDPDPGVGLNPTSSPTPTDGSLGTPEIRTVTVRTVQRVPVPVGIEKVSKASELAGEIRRRLGEWKALYRLPSGDFQALARRVEELQGLLQAAVSEMRQLGDGTRGRGRGRGE